MTREELRAVITGMGVVAPNGIGPEAFASALVEGRSGIGEIVSFDPEGTGRERAAEIPNFDETQFLRSPKNYLDRNSALAFAACEMAVRESGARLPDKDQEPGLALGSAAGNLESLALFHSMLAQKGPHLASPFLFPHTYMNTTAGLLSIEYGLSGPHACFCSGGIAGLEAVAFAADCLVQGRAQMMVAGGVEAFSEPLFHAAMGKGWLSPTDATEETCLPFAACRNGEILGEGAGLFVLESPERAGARGPRSLGQVRGFGLGSSAQSAMTGAIRYAGVGASNVDAVFAAAGGALREDEEEALAICDLFGVNAVPVVALKGLVGETLGASGALNLAAALVAIEKNVLPPVGHKAACVLDGIDLVVAAREWKVETAVINACGPGAGCWASLVVGR